MADLLALRDQRQALDDQIQDLVWRHVHSVCSPKEQIDRSMDNLSDQLTKLGFRGFQDVIDSCKANLTMAPIYETFNIAAHDRGFYNQGILYEWKGNRIAFLGTVDADTETFGGFDLDVLCTGDSLLDFGFLSWWKTEASHDDGLESTLFTRITSLEHAFKTKQRNINDLFESIPEEFRLILLLFLKIDGAFICQDETIQRYETVMPK